LGDIAGTFFKTGRWMNCVMERIRLVLLTAAGAVAYAVSSSAATGWFQAISAKTLSAGLSGCIPGISRRLSVRSTGTEVD